MKPLQPLIRHNEGVALIEFALIVPILFLLLFGGIEMTRLLLVHLRLERAGYVLADITTQYLPATNAGASGEINQEQMDGNIFPQLSRVMSPYDDHARQAAIITSVLKTDRDAVIQWQVASKIDTQSGCDNNTPQTCARSVVNELSPAAVGPGVRNTPANFSGEYASIMNSMPEGANVIVVEAFYYYQPILGEVLHGLGQSSGFSFVLAPQIFTKRTFFSPRNGALLDLPPDFPVR